MRLAGGKLRRVESGRKFATRVRMAFYIVLLDWYSTMVVYSQGASRIPINRRPAPKIDMHTAMVFALQNASIFRNIIYSYGC